MHYHFFRLFLTQRDQRELFDSEETRREYLFRVFTQDRIDFIGREIPFSYVFIDSLDSFLAGRIGRQKSSMLTDGPETGFAHTRSDLWHAVNLFLDTANDPDGQKLVIGESQQVGKPSSIAQHLIDHINAANPSSRWRITVNSITESHDFWEVATRFKGQLTELELEFVAPNIFGGKDQTSDVLRRLRRENNSQTTDVRLKNPDGGLNPDSDSIRESLEYIKEGGGNARLRVGKRTVYNTKTTPKTKEVSPDDDISVADQSKSLWATLVKSLFDT